MDIGQAAVTFVLAAAGAIGGLRGHQVMEKRRHAKHSARATEDATADTPRISRLFPNGERDQVIAAINRLSMENMARKNDIERNRIDHEEIMSTLREINARLARAGIE